MNLSCIPETWYIRLYLYIEVVAILLYLERVRFLRVFFLNFKRVNKT